MGTAVIKSELVQRIAKRNPQLFQRDVENIVNAILNEILTVTLTGEENLLVRSLTRPHRATSGPSPTAELGTSTDSRI